MMKWRGNRRILTRSVGLLAVFAVLSFETAPVKASSVSFVTPTGSTSGGNPVDAKANVTTSAGSITITLFDLQANPKDAAQLLSDIEFVVGNGGSLTGSSETGASSQERTVNGNGTFSNGSNLTTVAQVGWVYTTSGTTGGKLDVLQGPGHAGPAHLIIGPPGGATYANANGSIAGNNAHNPFLNQSASFTITAPNVSAATTITGVVFSFGTTEDASLIPGVPVSVPEPTTGLLMGIGLGGLGLAYRVRRRKAISA